MTSIRFSITAALLAATLGTTAVAPALAQDAAPASTTSTAAEKAPPATKVAMASQPAEMKPEQLLVAEPTAAGQTMPSRASVIAELKRARAAGAMDFASVEINGPAR